MTRRSAVIRTRSFKLSWVMSPERIPRDLIADSPTGSVEWQLQLSENTAPIAARFTQNDYQRMLREIDAQHGGAMITLQGYLNGTPAGFLLERTSFKVDRRRAPPPAPKPPTAPPTP